MYFRIRNAVHVGGNKIVYVNTSTDVYTHIVYINKLLYILLSFCMPVTPNYPLSTCIKSTDNLFSIPIHAYYY